MRNGSEHSVLGYQLSGEAHLVTRNLDAGEGDDELAVFGSFLVSMGETSKKILYFLLTIKCPFQNNLQPIIQTFVRFRMQEA